MKYKCCEERRLRVVRVAGRFNGVEYLEVALTPPHDPLHERTLLVRLLKPAAGITTTQVRIDGGERTRTVGVQWVAPADALPPGEDPALVAGLAAPDHVLVVRTDQSGDFSRYTLHIDEPATFDPLLMTVEFTFKVDCDGGFDCRDECVCEAAPQAPSDLDYLAKDYTSFRRLMLDRLSLVTPRWKERHTADLGIALVELIAYEADRLSYRQDAIATEAYLGTARRRISLRRHAKLVDYRIHDGCSARVLVRCMVEGDAVKLAAGTQVFSRVPALQPVLDPDGVLAALAAGAVVFETVDDAVLYAGHETLDFYTWGDDECCLPLGSTSATLHGDHPNLNAGDILVFSEVLSPTTGKPGDIDPAHTWPVRLTHVVPATDPSGGQFLEPPTGDPVAVTEITWDVADKLPFPLCVSATTATGPVSVAWGNIIVADQGATVTHEALGTAPHPFLTYPLGTRDCAPDEPARDVLPRFRPRLRYAPLTHSVDVSPKRLASTDLDPGVLVALTARAASSALLEWLSAHGVAFRDAPVVVRGGDGQWSVSDGETLVRIRVDGTALTVFARPMPATAVTAMTPQLARPRIHLTDGNGDGWDPQWDLLSSAAGAREFVVESEYDGTAYLRLNQPTAGTTFTARYRIGNGVSGNVGAQTLVHVATSSAVTSVVNPLPASGGHEPETGNEIRRDAPEAYLVQERAVTPADWADVATRDTRVQRAVATWRWTGSWHTVFLTTDPAGDFGVDATFAHDQRARLERYRLAGYDLELDAPRYVPIELELHVCVAGGLPRARVRREVLSAVGALYEPDRLTFAQPVYLSPVYAAIQMVPGVTSVNVTTFRRQQDITVSGLESGVLTMGRLEIARLDNDPNFPERGVLAVTLGGGL